MTLAVKLLADTFWYCAILAPAFLAFNRFFRLLFGLALWAPGDPAGKILCLLLMVGAHEGMVLVSWPKARYNKKVS